MKNLKIAWFDVSAMSSNRNVLFGEGRGRMLCERLIELTPNSADDLLVALDFGRVDHASASFLREAVLGYSGYLRSLSRNVFPFVANVNDETQVELLLILRDTGACLVAAQGSSSENLHKIEVLGLADGQHSKTLAAVRAAGEASVAELRKMLPKEAAAAGTALNGRLEWLSKRGLLQSRQEGREKRYYFPFVGG